MTSWEELDEEAKVDKDGEEANLGLMASLSYDSGSHSDSDDKYNELTFFSKEELINVVKELAGRCSNKSQGYENLKENFYLLEANIITMEK